MKIILDITKDLKKEFSGDDITLNVSVENDKLIIETAKERKILKFIKCYCKKFKDAFQSLISLLSFKKQEIPEVEEKVEEQKEQEQVENKPDNVFPHLPFDYQIKDLMERMEALDRKTSKQIKLDEELQRNAVKINKWKDKEISDRAKEKNNKLLSGADDNTIPSHHLLYELIDTPYFNYYCKNFYKDDSHNNLEVLSEEGDYIYFYNRAEDKVAMFDKVQKKIREVTKDEIKEKIDKKIEEYENKDKDNVEKKKVFDEEKKAVKAKIKEKESKKVKSNAIKYKNI